MRIGIEEVRDYIRCPLRYKFMYMDHIPVAKDADDYYKEYIKLSIFFCYFCMIEKKKNIFELMLKKWESLWFSNEMMKSFLEEYLRKKSTEAVIFLTEFYKKMVVEVRCPPPRSCR